ncbi:hypothetical protein PG987_005756 [Apiospora arundinis]
MLLAPFAFRYIHSPFLTTEPTRRTKPSLHWTAIPYQNIHTKQFQPTPPPPPSTPFPAVHHGLQVPTKKPRPFLPRDAIAREVREGSSLKVQSVMNSLSIITYHTISKPRTRTAIQLSYIAKIKDVEFRVNTEEHPDTVWVKRGMVDR